MKRYSHCENDQDTRALLMLSDAGPPPPPPLITVRNGPDQWGWFALCGAILKVFTHLLPLRWLAFFAHLRLCDLLLRLNLANQFFAMLVSVFIRSKMWKWLTIEITCWSFTFRFLADVTILLRASVILPNVLVKTNTVFFKMVIRLTPAPVIVHTIKRCAVTPDQFISKAYIIYPNP